MNWSLFLGASLCIKAHSRVPLSDIKKINEVETKRESCTVISVPWHLVGVVRIISVENSKRSVCTCTELPSWVPRHQCISSSTLERVTLLSEQPSECLNHRFRATKFLFLLSQQKNNWKMRIFGKETSRSACCTTSEPVSAIFLRLPGLAPDRRGSKEGDHPTIYIYREWQKRDSTHNGGARWCSPQILDGWGDSLYSLEPFQVCACGPFFEKSWIQKRCRSPKFHRVLWVDK